MKFKFSFQNVLKHRKILEDLAQRDFQEAQSRLYEEKNRLEKMKEEIYLARERAFAKTQEGGKTSPFLSQAYDFMSGQDIRIENQQIKIQECEKIVEELREILRQKAIDYKIIEGLRDKKKEEFATEQRKLEQKKADDLNMMRFRPDNTGEKKR
ncbi:MAG: hypothetical protein BroJett040_13840 [Oligoflexia bacterium]|nr:MAG: hypothetical protein BroJett040_13840 [Oligoflexia bacterium]